MKIKDGFTLRKVMQQSIVIGEGVDQVNFNKLISLNDSAALLWREVEGREFSVDDLAAILTKNYAIDAETAKKDASDIAAQWVEAGLVDA